LAARARPCAARTRHFDLITTPNGALRAHPPIAASLLIKKKTFQKQKYTFPPS
jgi:hypothetical protein